jgi:ketosteroid isomerase-like protein
VFDHVPYRFDGKQLFVKYLNGAGEGIVSASFGFRQPSYRVYGDTVGIVNAYDMYTAVSKDGKALSIHGRTTLVFVKHFTNWHTGQSTSHHPFWMSDDVDEVAQRRGHAEVLPLRAHDSIPVFRPACRR